MRARLATINKDFCHAVTLESQERVFIHASEMDVVAEQCQPGDFVEIGSIEYHARGTRGRKVTWLERPSLPEVDGYVVYIDCHRLIGFMRPSSSPVIGTNRSPHDVMFHVTSFADYTGESATFETLSRGDARAFVGQLRPTEARAFSFGPRH